MENRRRRRRAPSSERSKTDKSLHAEREKTDFAIGRDRDAAERGAEGVIDQARSLSDAAVKAERLKTDKAALRPARAQRPGSSQRRRARADKAALGQRASADAALRADLEGRADALRKLLALEREATDAYLLTERARSDDDVANRDDFLGMVAHDVRNLLNLVVLGLETIRPDEDVEPPPYVLAGKTRIRRYVARMNRLIGDLVDVTSIDAGKLAVEPVKADATALIVEATEAFQAAAQEKGLSLSVEVPEGPLTAVFDHDRILQVFANLLANAVKFTPRDGRIRVRVEKARGALRFSVSDTGVGIAAPMLLPIFRRFWQVGKSDRRGMGLGLYISKSIVEAHRGRIWATSTPGEGSQFFFTLPTAKARGRGGASKDPIAPQPAPARRRTASGDRRKGSGAPLPRRRRP
jgi:signal transduction histidine kinase